MIISIQEELNMKNCKLLTMVVVFRGNLQKVAQGTTEGKMEGGAEC